MHNKKLAVAIGAASIIATGAFIAFHSLSARGPQTPAAEAGGVVNPEQDQLATQVQPLPELSANRIELPASAGVGSYTEPAQRQQPDKIDVKKR